MRRQRRSGHWRPSRGPRRVVARVVIIMMTVMMLVILVRLTRGQGDVVELQHRQFAQVATGTCEADIVIAMCLRRCAWRHVPAQPNFSFLKISALVWQIKARTRSARTRARCIGYFQEGDNADSFRTKRAKSKNYLTWRRTFALQEAATQLTLLLPRNGDSAALDDVPDQLKSAGRFCCVLSRNETSATTGASAFFRSVDQRARSRGDLGT